MPLHLSGQAFASLVQEAFAALPPEVEHFANNVAIVIADAPSAASRRSSGTRGELLGLYEGVPRIAREGRDVLLPDRITLFQRALERLANNRQELKAHILVTLWHELGHHLGFSDRRLRQIERRILRRLAESETPNAVSRTAP